ncbi:MAG: DUF6763 family protein [Gammaproteobacteria bacterium]
MSQTPENEQSLPAIGDWYADEQGVSFEVVAVDEQDESVEVQYYDGTLEEFDLDAWATLELRPVEAPEDWSGPLDLEREDYGVDLDDQRHALWANPLDRLDE